MTSLRAAAVLACLVVAVAATAQEDFGHLLAEAAAASSAGDLTRAEAAFARALELSANDEERAQALSRLADMRRARGDREGALRALQGCLDMTGAGPWRSRALTQLGSVAPQVGRADLAREAYEALVRDFAGNPSVVGNAGMALARLDAAAGDHNGAVARLERLLASDPARSTALQARHLLVDLLLESGDTQRAAEAARSPDLPQPMRTDLLVRVAAALQADGEAQQAADLCREVLAERPDHPLAARRLYEIALYQDTLAGLIAELQEAAAKPDGEDALRRLADVYAWQGETAPALAALDRLLQSRPDNPDLLTRAGMMARDAGELDRAARWLSEVLRLQPGHRLAAEGLGEVHARRGETDLAVEMFKLSTGYTPEDPQSVRMLGRVLSEYSLHHEAIALYRQARATAGDETLMAYEMGRAWVGLMEYAKATSEFLTALSDSGEASVRLVGYELERVARDEVAGEAVVATLDEWVARPDLTDAQVLTVARTYFAAGRRERGLHVLDALPGEAGALVIELAREVEFSSSRELAADLYELALLRHLPPDQRADASLRVARLRLAEGDWRAALRLLDQPQGVREYSVEATLMRAEALLRHKRDIPAAREAFEQVARATDAAEGDLRVARWGLADCLLAEGSLDEAEAAFLALMDEPVLLDGVFPPPPPGMPDLPAGLVGPGAWAQGRDVGRVGRGYGALRLAEISLRRGDLEAASERLAIAAGHQDSVWANDAIDWMSFVRDNLDGRGQAEADYMSALGMLERGEFAAARGLLAAIVRDPAEPLADDALLIVARSHADEGDADLAVAAYERVASDFPDSLLAPEALLTAAELCEAKLGDLDRARRALQSLVETYPDSAAADEAAERLQSIAHDQ